MTLETARILEVLLKVREKKPLVHAITNWITANDVASCLHAIGARPIMATAPEEVEEITTKTDALVLNMGTPSQERLKAMIIAGHRANQDRHPIIFDPVGVGLSPFRIDSSKKILSELRLAVIRGNRSEIGMLSGRKSQLAGVDAVDGPEDLAAACRFLAEKTGAIVVATGPVDLIASVKKQVQVENGCPMMSQVTGMGCMLTAVIGAFCAIEQDPMVASVSAVAFFGVAGEMAAQQSRGPGAFKQAFFDALFSITPDRMREGMVIKYL